eukprot:9741229-Alexandrium_andersonii.AAC.1
MVGRGLYGACGPNRGFPGWLAIPDCWRRSGVMWSGIRDRVVRIVAAARVVRAAPVGATATTHVTPGAPSA